MAVVFPVLSRFGFGGEGEGQKGQKEKRTTGLWFLFHCLIPWRLSSNTSLFYRLVPSLDIKNAFHSKNNNPMAAGVQRRLGDTRPKEVPSGAGRYIVAYIVAKLERFSGRKTTRGKHVPDFICNLFPHLKFPSTQCLVTRLCQSW